MGKATGSKKKGVIRSLFKKKKNKGKEFIDTSEDLSKEVIEFDPFGDEYPDIGIDNPLFKRGGDPDPFNDLTEEEEENNKQQLKEIKDSVLKRLNEVVKYINENKNESADNIENFDNLDNDEQIDKAIKLFDNELFNSISVIKNIKSHLENLKYGEKYDFNDILDNDEESLKFKESFVDRDKKFENDFKSFMIEIQTLEKKLSNYSKDNKTENDKNNYFENNKEDDFNEITNSSGNYDEAGRNGQGHKGINPLAERKGPRRRRPAVITLQNMISVFDFPIKNKVNNTNDNIEYNKLEISTKDIGVFINKIIKLKNKINGNKEEIEKIEKLSDIVERRDLFDKLFIDIDLNKKSFARLKENFIKLQNYISGLEDNKDSINLLNSFHGLSYFDTDHEKRNAKGINDFYKDGKKFINFLKKQLGEKEKDNEEEEEAERKRQEEKKRNNRLELEKQLSIFKNENNDTKEITINNITINPNEIFEEINKHLINTKEQNYDDDNEEEEEEKINNKIDQDRSINSLYDFIKNDEAVNTFLKNIEDNNKETVKESIEKLKNYINELDNSISFDDQVNDDVKESLDEQFKELEYFERQFFNDLLLENRDIDDDEIENNNRNTNEQNIKDEENKNSDGIGDDIPIIPKGVPTPKNQNDDEEKKENDEEEENKGTIQKLGNRTPSGDLTPSAQSSNTERDSNQPTPPPAAPVPRDAGGGGSGGNNTSGNTVELGTANYGGTNGTSPNYTNKQMVNHISSLYYLVGTSNEYNGDDEAKVGVAVAHMLNARGGTNGIVPTLESLRDNLLSDFDINGDKCKNLGNYVIDKLESLGFVNDDYEGYLLPIYSMNNNIENKRNDPGIAEIVKDQLGNNLYGILDKMFIDKAAKVYKGTGKDQTVFLNNFYHNFDSGRKYIQQATVNDDNIELEGFYNGKIIKTEELKKAHESVNRMYNTLSENGKNAVDKDSEAGINLNIEQIEIAKKGMNYAERVRNQFDLDGDKVKGFKTVKNEYGDKYVALTNTQSTKGVEYKNYSEEYKDLVNKKDNYINATLNEESSSLDSGEFDEKVKNFLIKAYSNDQRKLADDESIEKVNINGVEFLIPAKDLDWVEINNKIGRDRGILPGMLEYMKEVAIVNGGNVEELRNLITVEIDGERLPLSEAFKKDKDKTLDFINSLGAYEDADTRRNVFLESDKELLKEFLGEEIVNELSFVRQVVSQSQGQSANAGQPQNTANPPSSAVPATNNNPPANPAVNNTNPQVPKNGAGSLTQDGQPQNKAQEILIKGPTNNVDKALKGKLNNSSAAIQYQSNF